MVSFELKEFEKQTFVEKFPNGLINEARWIFTPDECVFDETNFCV